MPNKAKRNVTVPAKAATVNAAATVKPAKRVIATATAKPAVPAVAVPAKPALPIVAAKPAADTNTQPHGLTRDAAGIVRYATNFNQYSSRDEAYLAFFGNVCRANSGKATLRQIHDAGITRSGQADRKRFNPNYTGSGKATDVGAINRLCKAGYFNRSADGNTISATPLAVASKAYSGKA